MYRVLLLAILCSAVSSHCCIGNMPCLWKHHHHHFHHNSGDHHHHRRYFGSGIDNQVITPAPRRLINEETIPTQKTFDLENMDVYRNSNGGRGLGGYFKPNIKNVENN
ncbi:unnamed protein product [Pieris brassicae]|uniref:Uncharacterized protein n=1 Tax=Pieris brassicae TaxID=7116 RepID=A0A9P0X284_PIEBR|nr:unnamed protein product [Pieris brassicae]